MFATKGQSCSSSVCCPQRTMSTNVCGHLHSLRDCCVNCHILPQAFGKAVTTCTICKYHIFIEKKLQMKEKRGWKTLLWCDVFFNGCVLSTMIFKISCWLGQDGGNLVFTSLGPIPKCSNVLPLREHLNLDRPLTPNSICKRRKAGAFYSCSAMLFLEEELAFT